VLAASAYAASTTRLVPQHQLLLIAKCLVCNRDKLGVLVLWPVVDWCGSTAASAGQHIPH
jgi:hypothetical protein